MSSETQKRSYSGMAYDAAFKNQHMVVLIFGIIFVIIALVGLFALWGAQTGSSQASGIGSLVMSSTSEDGEMSATTEVLSEFLIIMFTVLGIAMLTYVWVVDRNVKKLVDNGQVYGAILVSGNKKVTPEMTEAAKKDQLKEDIKDLNLPSSVIDAGLKSIKEGATIAARKTSNAGARISGAAAGAAAGYSNAKIKGKSSKKSPQVEDEDDDDENDDDDN